MPYVYSTATCPIAYVKYAEPTPSERNDRSSSGYNRVIKEVVINGGHGLADKHLFTPNGVATKVSDEDMEFLLQDQNFQQHHKDGFISYDKKNVDPAKKASNMAKKDGAAPLTPDDFKAGENDWEDCRIYRGIPKNKQYL